MNASILRLSIGKGIYIMNGETILVVDDNKEIVYSLGELFEI